MGRKLPLTTEMAARRLGQQMKGLRYIFYAAFALAAPLFWLFLAFFVLGWVPFGDPPCAFEPKGCEPTFWKQLLNLIVVWGAIPATALLFVFYRRWVRRVFGLEEWL